MRKCVFSALWMAFFAVLAAFPLWLQSDPEARLLGIVSSAVAGALAGGLLQPLAIGRHSNAIAAAVMGVFCATLCLPLVLLGTAVGVDPLLVFRGGVEGTLKALSFLLVMSFFGMARFWWTILPMGALAGLTLQLAWRSVENRQEMPRSGEEEAQ